MAKIKIVGETSTYDLEQVSDTIIQLGGEYYWKHSDQLVKVVVDGKKRLYRKTSPLLCFTLDRSYALKKNCHQIGENIWIEKTSPSLVKLGENNYSHAEFCVRIGNKWYLKSDEAVVKTLNNGYQLRTSTVQMASEVYGNNVYELNTPDLINIDGKYYHHGDVREVTFWNKTTGEQDFKYISRQSMRGNSNYVDQVFARFRDKTNPQLDRIDYCFGLRSEVAPCDLGAYCLIQQVEELNTKVVEIRNRMDARSTESARSKCNNNFSDHDDSENIAKRISSDYRIWGGKENIYGYIGDAITSKKFNLTGGLGYGFGVEIETSAGIIPKSYGEALGFHAVGDRSIGSAEYVTPVLQGNKGINYIEKLMKLVADHTFVDDRCAIHVHVGSPPEASSSNWFLNFDRRFAIASIKLGCLIEEDLYKMLPKSRNPYNRHCHSIMRYRGITEENWQYYLGAFVFGPEENWQNQLNFGAYPYGVGGRSKDSRLNNWCGGRYKWLNLVRAYSACNSRTIEFRIFSPTVNFDKVYNFILISLAFTYVADNHYREIMEGKVDLKTMLELAYVKYPELLTSLYAFIDDRVKKFNRTVVYNKTKLGDIRSIEPIIENEKKIKEIV